MTKNNIILYSYPKATTSLLSTNFPDFPEQLFFPDFPWSWEPHKEEGVWQRAIFKCKLAIDY